MHIHNGSITVGLQSRIFGTWSPAPQRAVDSQQFELRAQLRRQAKAARLRAKSDRKKHSHSLPMVAIAGTAPDTALGDIIHDVSDAHTQPPGPSVLHELRESYCVNVLFSGLVIAVATSPWLGVFAMFRILS